MPGDQVQLFCLPHSGASAQLYLRWSRMLPSWLVVRPVELPGRGARATEALRTDLVELAHDLAGEMSGGLGSGYALFGHSIGAVLAFEIAHALEQRGEAAPLRLFASASEAPAIRDDRDMAGPKSDAELIEDLRRLRGTPEDALLDRDLMDLVLPVLRADFLMCGGYCYRARKPLSCPITALGGAHDRVTQAALRAWSNETRGGFSMRLFDGGHFFIHAREREALDSVVADLANGAISRPAA